MRSNDFADLIADANRGMECHGWFLKKKRDVSPANLFQLSRLRSQNVPPLEPDDTFLNSSVGREQPEQRSSQRAFSRSGFTEYTQGFAGLDLEAHTRNCRTILTGSRSVRDRKVLNFEKRCHAMDQGRNFPASVPMFIQVLRANKAHLRHGARKVTMIGQTFLSPPGRPRFADREWSGQARCSQALR